MATRAIYREELERINNDVIKMGGALEHSFSEVIKALKTMDAKLAEEIIELDDEIDDWERNIEQCCVRILAKQQPVARDLRKVISVMRIISDLERIADHCGDISEYIIKISQEGTIPMPAYVLEMAIAVKKMVSSTIDSYVTEDIELAAEVIQSDDVIDKYFEDIMEELCIAMKYNPERIKAYAEYLMIIKYLERMADHATNVAEWISFIITGDLAQYMNND